MAQRPATRPASPLAVVNRMPEYAATARVPERLLNERVGQAIVLPSEPGEYGEDPERISGTGLAKLTPEVRPLPDGYMIGGRPGRIERQENGYMIRLDHVARLPDAPPLRVLPNARLALLESVLAETGENHRFLFTGRITEFQGANYVLVDYVAEEVRRRDDTSSARATRPSTPEAVSPAEPGQTETRPSGREPTAEELIRELMKDRPTRALRFPDEDRSPATVPAGVMERAVAATQEAEPTRWSNETLLSDRQARLVPGEAGVWMLAFEDRGKNPQDPAIRALPNRLLETAINLTAGGTKPVVLLISGEVTAHRGANFILLRKVLVRRNMGNLR